MSPESGFRRRATIGALVGVSVVIVAGALLIDSGDVSAEGDSRVVPIGASAGDPDKAVALLEQVPDGPQLTVPGQGATPPEQESVVTPGEALAATPAQIWSESWASVVAIMNGEMTQEQALELWRSVLSGLANAERTEHPNGFVTYELIGDPSIGAATLTLRPDGHPLPAYSIELEMMTPPGLFTGFPEDNAGSARLELALDLGDDGSVASMDHLVQLNYHTTKDLYDSLVERGYAEIPTGGGFSIQADGCTWTRITSRPVPSSADEGPIWNNTIGDRAPVEGAGLTASENDVDPIVQVLKALES